MLSNSLAPKSRADPNFHNFHERVDRLGLDFFDMDLRFLLYPFDGTSGYGGQWGVPANDATGETIQNMSETANAC